jgi:hypothetical protein
MSALNVRLEFHPAHGLHMRAREILSEHEHPSTRWPDITRLVTLYIDADDNYAVFVCFSPQGQSGNIDKVRCYRGRIGPRAEIADPLEAISSFENVAQAVEDEFAGKLAMFFGEPGEDEPIHWHAH